MRTTNENILESLADLEQSLKDINSAREQVSRVVKTSGDLAKVVESYQTSFENLSINVKAILEDSRKFNSDSIKKLSAQTQTFSKELSKLTDFDISKSLKSIESETIKQFQQNLSKPLADLDKQISNLEKDVTILTEFDFKDTFSNIEKQVVNEFKTDLKEKLDDLDNKAQDLQSKINEFKVQISRIEEIDLDSKFDNLLTVLTNHLDKKSVEISRKYDEVIRKSDSIIIQLDKHAKETKKLKNIAFVTIGIIIIGIAIALVMK